MDGAIVAFEKAPGPPYGIAQFARKIGQYGESLRRYLRAACCILEKEDSL